MNLDIMKAGIACVGQCCDSKVLIMRRREKKYLSDEYKKEILRDQKY